MKSLVRNLDRDKVVLILKWCQEKFGRSRYYRKYPRLRVYRSYGQSSYSDSDGSLLLYGTYNTGVISIYLGSHTSMKQLCSTVIHEYRHYLLSIQEYRSISTNMEKNGMDLTSISEHHPHEIECKKFEKEWADLCFSQLRKKLYSKS